jgi:RNA polymerase sigma-70 factor, ECF subfamily
MNWEAVYRKHSPGVYQYCLSLAQHSQEAEDLLQETFMRAMRSASGLQQPEKVRSWLLTIARNLFLDTRKKESRHGASSLETNLTAQAAAIPVSEGPESVLLRNDFTRLLQRTLAGLSETHQTAFTLGVVQKLNYREIAEITGWSAATVKINIYRARQKVAAALEPDMR